MRYLEASGRYLKISAWLRRRYIGKGVGRHPGRAGRLITHTGEGGSTRYTILDVAFFRRYVIEPHTHRQDEAAA